MSLLTYRLPYEQRLVVAQFVPKRLRGPGHPWYDDLDILDIILFAIRTGLPWRRVTSGAPSRHTCKRRYDKWFESGVLRRVLMALAEDLEYRAGIDAFDPDLKVPEDPQELASWEWQTVLLLRSSGAARILNSPRKRSAA